MALDGLSEHLQWIEERNRRVHVAIKEIGLAECASWHYSKMSGRIENARGAFFSVSGLKVYEKERLLKEQPIILQQEIGYLGLICSKIEGELRFLIQAKIEPGNVNKIQLSPTIQATKSNFTRKHGGTAPPYLEYFVHAKPREVLADQLQSEQASRFLGKRNRNIILFLEEEVPVRESHRWLTLKEIHGLMRLPNLVNMDLRTVLSVLPLAHPLLAKEIKDETVLASLKQGGGASLARVYHCLNDYKMFDEKKASLCPLDSLTSWRFDGRKFYRPQGAPFKVIFCDIEIEGREVRKWQQPLFAASGSALFGLFTKVEQGSRLFLLKATPEVGCFDHIELGPTLQKEATEELSGADEAECLFSERLLTGEGVVYDNLLSEEGGRFYHEENRNVLIELGPEELQEPPPGYFWMSYKTLQGLLAVNNCLNIQARDLLALWEW